LKGTPKNILGFEHFSLQIRDIEKNCLLNNIVINDFLFFVCTSGRNRESLSPSSSALLDELRQIVLDHQTSRTNAVNEVCHCHSCLDEVLHNEGFVVDIKISLSRQNS
jgi:hypothetical protein